MRRAPSSVSIEKTIGELVDQLTGEIETSIDQRTRALILSWGRNGTNGHSNGHYHAPATTARPSIHTAPAARLNGAGAGRPPMPLPRAEREFRVAYLRTLLAEVPNRREAARRAGVPYRTLCDMVRKLRIEA